MCINETYLYTVIVNFKGNNFLFIIILGILRYSKKKKYFYTWKSCYDDNMKNT